MSEKLVLVAGVTGQIGRCLADHFASQPDWRVIGLSRRASSAGKFQTLAIDLLDADSCRNAVADIPVTHLVYAARHDHSGGKPESADTNVKMLSNMLQALARKPCLQHIHLVHGTKYYGHALGPRKVPYREEDEKGKHSVFYYGQQDLLTTTQFGKNWGWTISRPHSFYDQNILEPRSLPLLIAAYASILKEMGEPLRFPGTLKAFHARTQFTWLPMLARSIEWMMTEPRCVNQAFNVVNDDPQRWDALWPAIADYFEMPWSVGDAIRLEDFPRASTPLWTSMAERYDLRNNDLAGMVQWAYGDYVFSPEWDVVSSMDKARKLGFRERVDTLSGWATNFDLYREHRLIP